MTVELRDLLVHQADSALARPPSEPQGDLWSCGGGVAEPSAS